MYSVEFDDAKFNHKYNTRSKEKSNTKYVFCSTTFGKY